MTNQTEPMDARELALNLSAYAEAAETRGGTVETPGALLAAAVAQLRSVAELQDQLREAAEARADDPSDRTVYHSEIRATALRVLEERAERPDEDLRDITHETLDAHSWVIYTAKAQAVLATSDNDGAMAEEYGADGVVEDGALQWSRLAYCAMEADVCELLDTLDGQPFADDTTSEEFLEALADARRNWQESEGEPADPSLDIDEGAAS